MELVFVKSNDVVLNMYPQIQIVYIYVKEISHLSETGSSPGLKAELGCLCL